MSKALKSLEDAHESMVDEFNNVKYGDVIGVDRSIYQHYGVYAGDNKVIHYAARGGDFWGGDICIHETTLENFLGASNEYFICRFPVEYGTPSKIILSTLSAKSVFASQWLSLIDLLKLWGYKLYSPEETVQRALGRLGENKYNLVFNNCEHFAIWCKTGISESHQVNDVLKTIPLVPVIL
jgi:hypothetical protein